MLVYGPRTTGADLETTGHVWIYTPQEHKTEHHGRVREVYFGPRALAILKSFLKTDLQAYLFSPREVEQERRAEMRVNRKSPVQPSQRDRRKEQPQRPPRERYDTNSYRRAIQRAIDKANRSRRDAGEPEIPRWSPNQLRHNAATRARKMEGLETSQVILGHSRADVTQVYAERDRERAVSFMLQHG